MDAVQDFEDLIELLAKHEVRYLIIGGLAFVYHAKPRYTKGMDIWIDFTPQNIEKANLALAEFGSPELLSLDRNDEILQLVVAPNRIDFLLSVQGIAFDDAWKNRIKGSYGDASANWLDIDTLLAMKSGLHKREHQEDARILREVKKMKSAQ